MESDRDDLVHWCHGAPGMALLFTKAFLISNQNKYLEAAENACEFIWHRGLLKKGPGLCHGIAGNGYSFLKLYNVTKVCLFAKLCHSGNFSVVVIAKPLIFIEIF